MFDIDADVFGELKPVHPIIEIAHHLPAIQLVQFHDKA